MCTYLLPSKKEMEDIGLEVSNIKPDECYSLKTYGRYLEALDKANKKAKEEADKKANKKAKEEADKEANKEAKEGADKEANKEAKEEANKEAKEEADKKAKEEADKEATREYKLLLLYRFVTYLAFVSNGSPKKITSLIQQYVCSTEYLEANEKVPNDISKKQLKKYKYYLSFGFYEQQKIGFIHYLISPVMLAIINLSLIHI